METPGERQNKILEEMAKQDLVGVTGFSSLDPPSTLHLWKMAVKHSAYRIMRTILKGSHASYVWRSLMSSEKWDQIKIFLSIATEKGTLGKSILIFLPIVIRQYLLTLGIEMKSDTTDTYFMWTIGYEEPILGNYHLQVQPLPHESLYELQCGDDENYTFFQEFCLYDNVDFSGLVPDHESDGEDNYSLPSYVKYKCFESVIRLKLSRHEYSQDEIDQTLCEVFFLGREDLAIKLTSWGMRIANQSAVDELFSTLAAACGTSQIDLLMRMNYYRSEGLS